MKEEQAKLLAYELTMGYIKAGSKLLQPQDKIPSIVNDFADIYEKFYSSITENEKLGKLL